MSIPGFAMDLLCDLKHYKDEPVEGLEDLPMGEVRHPLLQEGYG
jgi:hypothetical protein